MQCATLNCQTPFLLFKAFAAAEKGGRKNILFVLGYVIIWTGAVCKELLSSALSPPRRVLPPATSGTEHGAVAGVELQTKVHTKHRNHGEGP